MGEGDRRRGQSGLWRERGVRVKGWRVVLGFQGMYGSKLVYHIIEDDIEVGRPC